MPSCQIDGCERAYYGLGFCERHYKRFKKYGDPLGGIKPHGTLEERFWPKVEKGEGCWEWTGARTNSGYGMIQEGGKGSRHLSAHRVSYVIHKGPIPDGMMVLHSCDNRGCVNPRHLRSGTGSENIQEAHDKGRKTSPVRRGEANGKSLLNQQQVAFIKAHPELPHTELARLFSVSPNCIRGVRIGRTWRE